VKLTEKEQADLDYKKRVYELAKKKTEAVDDAMEVRRPTVDSLPIPHARYFLQSNSIHSAEAASWRVW